MEFESFQKLARLSREVVITEKIDGTNGCIAIGDLGEFFVGSRTRWITPEDDNFGFARWAHENRDELLKLGPGRHFGEWWPACCHVVPVLFQGIFTQQAVDSTLALLASEGSRAAPGFMDPEGIVLFHTAASALFKKTLKGDEEGKHAEAHPPKPKLPKPPKDPSKGGRRVAQLPFEGPDRRKARVAQLVEHLPCKQGVEGSNPSLGTESF